jgi:hypothetical protein
MLLPVLLHQSRLYFTGIVARSSSGGFWVLHAMKPGLPVPELVNREGTHET